MMAVDQSMFAAPDGEPPELEGPPTRAEWFRERDRVASLARWNEERTRDIDPILPPPTVRSDLDEILDNRDEWLAKLRAKEAAHKAQCEEDPCSRCGRYACGRCGVRMATNDFDECLGCAVTEALEEMEVPARYRDAAGKLTERVRNPAAIELARSSLDAKKVVLVGHSGSGKSSLLAGMVTARKRAVLKSRRKAITEGRHRYEHLRNERLLWASAISIGRSRSTHRLGDGEPEAFVDAMEADLLALDDLGAETAREADVLSELIHARHDADRALWITIGISADDVVTRYSGGVERRIFEGAIVLNCEAPK